LAAGGAEGEEGGMPGGGGGGGSMSMSDPLGAPAGGEGATTPGADLGAPAAGGETAPLAEEKKEPAYRSESNKMKILSMLGEDTTLADLFDNKKAQENIYEMDKAISDIISDNAEGENKLIKEQTDD